MMVGSPILYGSGPGLIIESGQEPTQREPDGTDNPSEREPDQAHKRKPARG